MGLDCSGPGRWWPGAVHWNRRARPRWEKVGRMVGALVILLIFCRSADGADCVNGWMALCDLSRSVLIGCGRAGTVACWGAVVVWC
jgi:hypothetical protein